MLSLGGVEFFALYKQDIAGEEELLQIASQISDQLFFVHDDVDNDVEDNTTSKESISPANSKIILFIIVFYLVEILKDFSIILYVTFFVLLLYFMYIKVWGEIIFS